MSEKRRDNRNRVLRTGESQRKDGRYVYKYNPAPGISRFVYSWKLVPTDRVPSGKQNCPSLREKEQVIRRDLEDGISPLGGNMTVCQLYEKQNRCRPNVRAKTVVSRGQLMRLLREDGIGLRPIASVRMSDAKEWALRMARRGYAYNTIRNHKRSLSAAFHLAVQDDLLRKNPFSFKLGDVLCDDTPPREPLSPTQEASLLAFVAADAVYSRYLDEIVILLRTGLRVSEFCGLTDPDLDFEAGVIRVERQLLKEHGVYYTAPPKTKSGTRLVPMCSEAREALIRLQAKRHRAAHAPIDGHRGFLLIARTGMPKVAGSFEKVFHNLAVKYNARHADPLPAIFTPHTMRHTFCTAMANAGMNPKALQYIMGHSSIQMTLDYYAHATPDSAIAEMRRLFA